VDAVAKFDDDDAHALAARARAARDDANVFAALRDIGRARARGA